jgi:Tfp pilus assembly protein PilF
MRRLLFLSVCLAFPMTALARSAPTPDIRPVQTDSTDVFEVLTRLRRAQDDLTHRDYPAARDGFESVLMHDPSLEAARAGLRRTLIALGDIQSALPLMEDEASPDSVIIRIRAGQVDTPKTLLTATLKRAPDPRLWTVLGQIQDAQSDFLSARQSYAMAGLAGARPGLAENNIGQSHWLANEPELALKAFERAVALDPHDTQFDNNRRRTLVRLGRTQDAISGLNAERAGLFLAKAGDKATAENETNLARLLYQKSLDIAPRHNPLTAEKLARLK